jgi:hypothetical protein
MHKHYINMIKILLYLCVSIHVYRVVGTMYHVQRCCFRTRTAGRVTSMLPGAHRTIMCKLFILCMHNRGPSTRKLPSPDGKIMSYLSGDVIINVN